MAVKKEVKSKRGRRPLSEKKKDEEKEVVNQCCTKCGKTKVVTSFYMSTSVLYENTKRLTVCKDCVWGIYDLIFEKNEDVKKSIHRLCRLLDMSYSESMCDAAIKQAQETNSVPCKIYFQKVNSLGQVNEIGVNFETGDILNEDEIEIRQLKKIYGDKEIELTSDLIHKWGKLSRTDICYLENEYKEWETRYEVASKSMEILVKEICYQQLMIKTKRENGQPVDKEVKIIQELMNSGALKPIQESAIKATDQQTFGTLIKKWENEKPIPEIDEDLKDVDGLKKYVSTWFTGHLSKMMSIENEFSKQYEEEMMKYTVNIPDAIESSIDFEGENNG